ncbi:ABC transporter, putative, partial [Ixodes scapularis]
MTILLFGAMTFLEPTLALTPSLSFSCIYLLSLSDMVTNGASSLLRLRSQGRIGYVPQIATVYNMSVRDNILFGQPLDLKRYERVLHLCQLVNDLNRFPAGDLTEVAYNRCDIYLLDDSLSALDPMVAAQVYQHVLSDKGILRNKTRILVSNQGCFLHEMNQMLLVHGQGVTSYTNMADLLKDPRAPESLSRGLPSPTTPSFTNMLFRCMGSALLAASNRQLSQSLHDNMLSHVLFSPVSFFDVTPRGRIMNRFSVDLDAIDNRMYLSTKQCIQNSLHTVARFAVVGTQAPAVVLVGVLVTVALLFAMLGVIGRTGSGKSSLVRALLRVLKSSRGRVCIDGTDIACVPLRKLRTAITVIPQDPNLVRGSLRGNLDPRGQHSDSELWQALDQAHLKEFVERDANGLLLEAGDGGTNLRAALERQLFRMRSEVARQGRLLPERQEAQVAAERALA